MSPLSRRRFVQSASGSVLAASLPQSTWALPAPEAESNDTKLWFDAPATAWLGALPIGNGFLGAMVFGGGSHGEPHEELLQLNETTLWSGMPRDGNNPHAKEFIPAIRKAVLEQQDYHFADTLAQKMQGKHTEQFQPLGNLHLRLHHSAKQTDYRRELDLDTACARVVYTVEKTRFERELFISAPDNILILRQTASTPASLNGTVTLDAALQRSVEAAGSLITLTGKAPSHAIAPNHPGGDQPLHFSDVPGEGMSFVILLQVAIEGGTLAARNGTLEIANADAFTITLSAATGFRGFQQMPDTPIPALRATALKPLQLAAATPYRTLRARHIAAHQHLFRTVSLSLGPAPDLPTDKRLAAFQTAPDPSLIALYFQYGRYLLLSCSRPSSQPANLQGMWNPLTSPPWGSNWTGNINIQMNYWPAETCNLGPAATPLVDFIHDLAVTGTRTATESYGLAGWCAHHNIDLWRASNAAGEGVGKPTWGSWCMAGPWLCAHLYEHFLFTGDRTFLRERAYPPMRGAAEFCLAWLTPDPNSDSYFLTTCPSESTENDFLAPDGKPADTSAGCTMDIALIRELFANCVATCHLLDIDHDFAAKLEAATTRLPPYRVGSHGQLQEWSIDFAESTPGQRHMSHLYPLYPGSQIVPRKTPALARAARVSLERRLAAGGAYTGWSRAWAINLWARLVMETRRGSRSPCSCSTPRAATSSISTPKATPPSSRSTATSAQPQPSLKCFFKATPAPSTSCPRCPLPGLTATSGVSEPAVRSPSISTGPTARQHPVPSARTAIPPSSFVPPHARLFNRSRLEPKPLPSNKTSPEPAP